jgi:hypothetical protein
MKASAKTTMIKSLIEKAGSQFVSITFTKKDDTERTIRFNPKYRRVLGERASESAKKAVATRKENNPNLLAVMDIDLRQKGTPELRCWRSINTEKVTRIAIAGTVFHVE